MAVFWYKKDFKRFLNRNNHIITSCAHPRFRGGGIWRQIWWWQKIDCFIALARDLLTVICWRCFGPYDRNVALDLGQHLCLRPANHIYCPHTSQYYCIISTYLREWYTSPHTSSFLWDPAYSILWKRKNIFLSTQCYSFFGSFVFFNIYNLNGINSRFMMPTPLNHKLKIYFLSL